MNPDYLLFLGDLDPKESVFKRSFFCVKNTDTLFHAHRQIYLADEGIGFDLLPRITILFDIVFLLPLSGNA